ncbi:MAG: sodium:proton exchanger, partial [SAR324 cluster bacterium]|nr:sodium:proton exchanger [SAR324 cluster bacterium]
MNKTIFYRFAVTLAFGLLASMPVYAGGGGWLIKPLGLMLGGAMIITIILTWLKQANILSFIIMGVAMGVVLGTLPGDEMIEGVDIFNQPYVMGNFPGMEPILSGFQEIGIILVLFMAGVNFNLKDITK